MNLATLIPLLDFLWNSPKCNLSSLERQTITVAAVRVVKTGKLPSLEELANLLEAPRGAVFKAFASLYAKRIVTGKTTTNYAMHFERVTKLPKTTTAATKAVMSPMLQSAIDRQEEAERAIKKNAKEPAAMRPLDLMRLFRRMHVSVVKREPAPDKTAYIVFRALVLKFSAKEVHDLLVNYFKSPKAWGKDRVSASDFRKFAEHHTRSA